MKPYHKLSKQEKYTRVIRWMPIYVIGIVVFYWKLDFWLATVVTIILIALTLIQLYFLKRDTLVKK